MNNCKNYSDEKSVFWKIFQLRDNKLFKTTIGIFYEYFRLNDKHNMVIFFAIKSKMNFYIAFCDVFYFGSNLEANSLI